MWILESDGEFLQGKRVWLRPGKRYLFGRVKKEGVAHAIDHKTISRKHFIIEVDSVKPGQGTQVYSRSKVTITDEKTKGGTFIDGVELRDGSRELKGKEHTIKPGKYPHALRIKWHQVCLSFSFSSKEMKGDPLSSRQDRLEELDIKTIIDYAIGETTHVVTNKRNTSKGLQALINGKRIVNNSYIDALVYAATSEDLSEPENLCPLERDFDAAWPDPAEHLPPPGKEIISPPAAGNDQYFGPNPDRQTIFEGFTFVFCSKEQYENLLPMITNGHGKALLFPMENGKTSADELELFMQNTAGRKGFGDADTQQSSGGVVLVRWIAKGDMQQWADELADEVSLRIDQRPVEQGDFLNIILNNTPSLLRRSCDTVTSPRTTAAPVASSRHSRASNSGQPSPTTKPAQSSLSPAANDDSNPPQSTRVRPTSSPDESEQPPPKRQRVRGIVKSRFKTFDDGLDVEIDSIPQYQPADSQPSLGDSMLQSEAPTTDDASQARSYVQSQQESHINSSDDDRNMDDLLPATAAMKRQLLGMKQKGKTSKIIGQMDKIGSLKKVKKVEKEIDVLEMARKRREAEEEALQKDREALEHASVDVENARNLAVVLEMDLPVRTGAGARANGQASDRWDEMWNGRKNFKKFRRRGEGETRPRLLQNVIVPVEEAKRPSYGIGQEYWNDSSHSTRKDSQRSRVSQTQLQITTSSEPVPTIETISPTSTRLQQEAEEIAGTIDVDEPRSTRGSTQQSSALSQGARTKRPGTDQNGTAPKRPRTLRMQPADDDSDDELKFRFGRRKK